MSGVLKRDAQWKELLKRPTYGQTIGLPGLLPGNCVFSYNITKVQVYVIVCCLFGYFMMSTIKPI
jgi:hypothetical protein